MSQVNEPGIDTAIARAKLSRLPATLTQDQWNATLAYFENACAYCGTVPWTAVEHATPLPPGGTTVTNCLPACGSCNSIKRYRTLEEMAAKQEPGSPQNWQRALVYLREKGRTDLEAVLDKETRYGPQLLPKNETVAIKLSKEDLRTWKRAAVRARRKLSDWIRVIVDDYLARQAEHAKSDEPDEP